MNNKEDVLLEALRKLAWYPIDWKGKGNRNPRGTHQEMCDIAFKALVEYGDKRVYLRYITKLG